MRYNAAMFERMVDRSFQIAYRIAYPLALFVRRFRIQRHDGVTIAVWHKDSVLMVRHSYRAGVLLPGGGRKPGEDPQECILRELKEEVGIVVDMNDLRLVEIRTRFEGIGEVHLFELDINDVPQLAIDNREIIFADFIHISEINTNIHDGMMRDYLTAKKENFKRCHISV